MESANGMSYCDHTGERCGTDAEPNPGYKEEVLSGVAGYGE
jgi:hypothetical protein